MSATGKKGVKRKVSTQTIEFKFNALEEVEKGQKSKTQICQELQISNSTLSTWIKNSSQIKEGYNNLGPKRKTLKTGKWEELEAALLQWFTTARSQNHAIITGETLLAKTEEYAKGLDIANFNASKGWLSRFKERHSISVKTVCGESNSVNDQSEQMTKWADTRDKLMQEYSADDIYNADETGLFFKMLPDKTLEFKSQDCHGTKKSKERLTVMVCANMSGTDKLPLMVIGKAAKPRCFKNVKTLPTEYTNNKNAWMTSEIFETWLRKVDRKMERQGRKIAMIIDNCPAHPAVSGLKAVKLVFLPPNTTSKTQPMDQGVIHNLKVHYRKRVVVRQIRAIDKNADFSLTVLDAMKILKVAWDCVSTSTVSNCYRHAGFQTPATMTASTSSSDDEDDELDDIPLAQLAQLNTPETLQDFIEFNEDVQVAAMPTDAEIMQSVVDARHANADAETDDADDDVAASRPRPTVEQAMDYVEGLVLFFERLDQSENELSVLSRLSRKVMREKVNELMGKRRQSCIKDFFKPGESTRM